MVDKTQPVQAGTAVRYHAARVLLSVIEDYQSLDDALLMNSSGLSKKDHAFLQALTYGVMRNYYELLWWQETLAKRKSGKLDAPVRVLILIGLYQLEFMRVPAHAAIHSTVECAGKLSVSRARGFINAVLREFQRSGSDIKAGRSNNKINTAEHNHADWMLDIIQKDWPEDWLQIIDANNRQAPMTLRVDINATDRGQYRDKLQEQGIDARVHEQAKEALVLEQSVDVEQLPGFADGVVSVQDAAAQLAVPLLDIQSQHRVLDACAAPGGKTAHIMQRSRPALLHALDNNLQRVSRINSMLERIPYKGEINVLHADAGKPSEWWDAVGYDRILLDVPCSASGVIRRHPDIKYLRTKRSLDKIVTRQRKIIKALWPLLKQGGMMLYVTCSIFKTENERQVSWFLGEHKDAELCDMSVDWGRGRIGRQILPGEQEMDGFYFALIKKL